MGCGVFIISTKHVFKYVHCFAIVDKSCTPLCVHVASLHVDRHSFLAASLSHPRRKSTGRASTSARIGVLRVVRIDPSSGADTSSARTRGGGRPAELKVVIQGTATFAKNGTQPEISLTPLFQTSRGVTLIFLKIYSPTSCYQFTNGSFRIGELMTKNSWTKVSPSWTV